jgi:CBS domain containing-hemolysin-like protein
MAESCGWLPVEYGEDLREELAALQGNPAMKYLQQIEARKHPCTHEWCRLAKLQESSTVNDLLDLVVSQGVHRAYVCDSSGQALAIVTLTDLLYCFAGEEPNGRPRI